MAEVDNYSVGKLKAGVRFLYQRVDTFIQLKEMIEPGIPKIFTVSSDENSDNKETLYLYDGLSEKGNIFYLGLPI